MTKTLIYFPPEYRDLALKIRENYIEHHHGEVDLVSETDQNDIKYARKNKFDEAIFIEDGNTVVFHATIIVFTLKVLQMINCFLIFEYIVAIFRFLTYKYIESGIEAS